MTRSIGLSLILGFAAALLTGCGDRAPPPLEITTRAGGTFVVVHPLVDYQRICGEGDYAFHGDPEERGLRIRADADARPEDQGIPLVPRAGDDKSDVVAWAGIAEIAFEQPVGDLGAASQFCEGNPDAISAAIRYRDDHQDRRRLIDTTDEGIRGVTERGRVAIPLRAIAKLRPVEDKGWDWVKKYEADHLERDRARRAFVVKVTTDAGKVVDFIAPSFFAHREKGAGNRHLVLARIDSWELIVFLPGAKVHLAWPDLQRVEIDDPDKLTARITYGSGRAEAATVAQGRLETTLENSVDMAHVRRIDVVRQGS